MDGHVSIIRGLDVSADGSTLVSGSRDRVVNVWDISQIGQGSLKSTVPVLETLEAVGLIESVPLTNRDVKGKGKGTGEDRPTMVIYTAGDKGIIRLWSITTGEPLFKADLVPATAPIEIVDVV